MAIVYRHRRKDNLEIFYVGIGKEEKRAYNDYHRTAFWKRIVAKAGYEVEIVKRGISWEDACELEILLISEYGRVNTGEGNLCNFTDGGDGVLGRKVGLKERYDRGRIISKYDLLGNYIETFNSMSEAVRFHKNTDTKLGTSVKCSRLTRVCKGKEKSAYGFQWKYGKSTGNIGSIIHNTTSKMVHKLDDEGNIIETFSSIVKATKSISLSRTAITVSIKRGNRSGGFYWRYETPKRKIDNKRKVYQYNRDGDFIKEYYSVSEAAKDFGGQSTAISSVCRGRRKSYKNFIWKYERII